MDPNFKRRIMSSFGDMKDPKSILEEPILVDTDTTVRYSDWKSTFWNPEHRIESALEAMKKIKEEFGDDYDFRGQRISDIQIEPYVPQVIKVKKPLMYLGYGVVIHQPETVIGEFFNHGIYKEMTLKMLIEDYVIKQKPWPKTYKKIKSINYIDMGYQIAFVAV